MRLSATTPKVTDKFKIEVPTHEYYVYSLRFNGSKFYYIGVSKNPLSRKAKHLKSISNIIAYKKSHRSNCYHVHAHIAKELKYSVEKWVYANNFLWKINFDVIAKCDTPYEARIIETEMISKSGKYGLNTQKTSHYGKNI